MSTTKHILIAIFFCLSAKVFGQKLDSTSLSLRVHNLEEYRANLEKLYQLSAKELNQAVDAKIDEKTKDLTEAHKTLSLLLWVGVPGTMIALLGVYFGATIKAKKMMVEKIEKIVEHKREEIIRLIETQEFDTRLRKTKKLMVLSSTEKAQDLIKAFFTRVQFSSVNYRIVGTYQDFGDYDLIVFNDCGDQFDENIIDEYLKNAKNDDVSFVAYTSRQLKRDPRLNFSNSQFTLYHSILSTLKYAEILKLTN